MPPPINVSVLIVKELLCVVYYNTRIGICVANVFCSKLALYEHSCIETRDVTAKSVKLYQLKKHQSEIRIEIYQLFE